MFHACVLRFYLMFMVLFTVQCLWAVEKMLYKFNYIIIWIGRFLAASLCSSSSVLLSVLSVHSVVQSPQFTNCNNHSMIWLSMYMYCVMLSTGTMLSALNCPIYVISTHCKMPYGTFNPRTPGSITTSPWL